MTLPKTTRIVTREGSASEAFIDWMERRPDADWTGAVIYNGTPGASVNAWIGADRRAITRLSVHNPTGGSINVTLTVGGWSDTLTVAAGASRTMASAQGRVLPPGVTAVISGPGTAYVTITARQV